ncbi:hypothetical protein [Methylobacter sp. S3L5C]|uniref:hypothetical protein n=1 Tax=Methylobacter sp. S3L5C TaxID=2839024 RepID=UPI001FADA6D4|nr:hypothetical protein [Methylobacter sp. S3L5C]UOA07133.1 hypothetical protein KKZ03_12520 [Methylobacter sp. S3L5C]
MHLIEPIMQQMSSEAKPQRRRLYRIKQAQDAIVCWNLKNTEQCLCIVSPLCILHDPMKI